MNSASTFAVSQCSTSGTLKKEVGNHKSADFELALESSQSADAASLIGIERSSKILIGQRSVVEENIDENENDKLASDQKNEPKENIENKNMLYLHAMTIETALKKLSHGKSLQDNILNNETKPRVSSEADIIVSTNNESYFYHGNVITESETKNHFSIDENFSSTKEVANEKQIAKMDYRNDNRAKFEDLESYKSSNFAPVDVILNPQNSVNMSNLTNSIVDIVIKDIDGEHPVTSKSGSQANHDFQPKIGTKFLRLHLEPQDLGPLTLCLRNDAEGLSVVVQTLATDVHQKLIEDKESMMRELNERGVLISEMQIQLHSGKDTQTASEVNVMSERGAFDNKSSERGSSKNNNHLPPSDSDEQIKHAIDEKTLGTYI